MANPYVNKVVQSNGTTLIDISDTTAVASDVMQGKYFYLATGEKVQGSASGSAVIAVEDETDAHGGTIRHITGVSLLGDTVSASTLLYGVTAHAQDGTALVGEYVAPTPKTASDVTVLGATVTIPAGAYSSQVQKSVASGTAGTPTASKGTVSNHAISVTPSVTNTEGYISGGTKTGTAVSVSASELVSGTLTISSSGTKDVTNYASASVSAGTAGTPTATKGTVSNHSVSITPSVTNTAGFISSGTKTGTAVTVSASELVSGSETKTTNGTYDVTNLASLVVNVSGGSSKNIQIYYGYASVRNNGYIASNATLTVAKTGTYKVSWVAWRSSSQGTMGTNLHRNSTTGTNQQTFTNTYGQQVTLTNQSYSQGDVLTIYATSGSTSRTINIANFVIEEV